MANKDAFILEVGAGSGRITGELVDAGYHHLVATDVDPSSESQLPPGTPFFRADATRDPLPAGSGSVDAVLLVHLIEHLTDPDHLLMEVRRVVSPTGVVVVVTPDFRRSVKRFYEDRTHVHPYVPKSLHDTLEYNALSVVLMTHTNVRRPFGRLTPLWRRVPRMVFTGNSILAVARPNANNRRYTAYGSTR